ncbi:hypothetical protein VOLCADRAFT_121393 [Volvox carteri f. nagariensis]|uniref:WW domain-containing oxidoreductase n=1 Tax=Volvox carteri f. nagariensis TaxID=3068 RepID=D8U963_VOLCA|nr:uncharacterized protein VOLCADRAFT_121393 [Volvox carteri f. nagariensis]EFJ43754.1 hypothetical protein VOLCADRAFT_121393 [Volvox carteri f. nagariensis]|eukprot:XP_002955235.1 hypothetical protein VOLCADRAFT_121393 [Volvox carteri f. nagariensis]
MVVAQRVLITGGNTGIGFEAARQLLQRGHHVIITCRDANKAKKAVDALSPVAEASGATVKSALINLASLSSVRTGAAQLLKEHPRLDVLCCNAGMLCRADSSAPLERTEDGQEQTLQVNHLAHFLLVHLMLPALLASPAARVVVVSSELHRKATAATGGGGGGGSSTTPQTTSQMASLPVPLASPEWITRLGASASAGASGGGGGGGGGGTGATGAMPRPTGFQLYCTSKLYNLWFVYKLAGMLPASVRVNAVTPGWVPGTALGRDMPWMARLAYQYVFPLLPGTTSVAEGARRVVEVCVGQQAGAAVTGTYFSRGVPTESSAESRDEEAAEALWRLSEQITGVKPGGYVRTTLPQEAETTAAAVSDFSTKSLSDLERLPPASDEASSSSSSAAHANTPHLHTVLRVQQGFNTFAVATFTFYAPPTEPGEAAAAALGSAAQHAAQVGLLALRGALGASRPPSALVVLPSLELPKQAVEVLTKTLAEGLMEGGPPPSLRQGGLQGGPATAAAAPIVGCSSRLRLPDERRAVAESELAAAAAATTPATAGDGMAAPNQRHDHPRRFHVTLAAVHLPDYEVVAIRCETALQGRRPPAFLLMAKSDSMAGELLTRLEGPFQRMLLDRDGGATATASGSSNSTRGSSSSTSGSNGSSSSRNGSGSNAGGGRRRRPAPGATSAGRGTVGDSGAGGGGGASGSGGGGAGGDRTQRSPSLAASAVEDADAGAEAATAVHMAELQLPYVIVGDQVHGDGGALLAVYPKQPAAAITPSSSSSSSASSHSDLRLGATACDLFARLALGSDHLHHVVLWGSSSTAISPPSTGPEPVAPLPAAPDNPFYWAPARVDAPGHGVILFPGQTIQLRVFEKRYRLLVRACVEDGAAFGLCWRGVGTTAVVRSYHAPEHGTGDVLVLLEGGVRFSYDPEDIAVLPASYGLNAATRAEYVVDDPPDSEEDAAALVAAAHLVIDAVAGVLEESTTPSVRQTARTFANALHFASSNSSSPGSSMAVAAQSPSAAAAAATTTASPSQPAHPQQQQQQQQQSEPQPSQGNGPITTTAGGSVVSSSSSGSSSSGGESASAGGAGGAGGSSGGGDAALLAGDLSEAKRVMDAETASLLSLYLAPHIPVHLESLRREWFTSRSALWRLQQEAAWLRSRPRVAMAVASSVLRLPREHPLRVMMGLTRVAVEGGG